MKSLSTTLRWLPTTGTLVAAGALCLALPNPALAQDRQSQMPQATQPQGQQATQGREVDQMLQQLESARRSFDQAAQGGAGKAEQARQQAESALQEIEQKLSQIEQQGGARMQRDIDVLKSDLEQAKTDVQSGEGSPDKAARSLQRVEASLRKVRQQMAQAGRASGSQAAQEQTRVRVQQPSPQIEVQKQAPEVTVRQPQPEITVQQPKPEVTVKQPEPNVTVEQAKPDVNVTQQGKPQIEVEREQGAQVEVTRPGQENRQAAQSEQPQTGSTGAAISGDRLVGKQIQDARGENIGEVQDVVLQGDRVEAVVVEVGGFLGMGERRVAIPTDRLSLKGENLRVGMTQQEIEQLPEYKKEK